MKKKTMIGLLLIGMIGVTKVNTITNFVDNISFTGDKDTKVSEVTEQKLTYDEYMDKVKNEPTFTEKFEKSYRSWVTSPNNYGSPFEDENGNNPVYDGMLEETQEKPSDDNSPFYTEDGVNIIDKNK